MTNRLLCRSGADPKAIPYEVAVRARDPMILRWLEDNGIDLETDNPVAMAIKFKHRPALGTLNRCMERLRTARFPKHRVIEAIVGTVLCRDDFLVLF